MPPPAQWRGVWEQVNEEWLDTVMGLMAEIVAAVYSNEKVTEKEQESG